MEQPVQTDCNYTHVLGSYTVTHASWLRITDVISTYTC